MLEVVGPGNRTSSTSARWVKLLQYYINMWSYCVLQCKMNVYSTLYKLDNQDKNGVKKLSFFSFRNSFSKCCCQGHLTPPLHFWSRVQHFGTRMAFCTKLLHRTLMTSAPKHAIKQITIIGGGQMGAGIAQVIYVSYYRYLFGVKKVVDKIVQTGLLAKYTCRHPNQRPLFTVVISTDFSWCVCKSRPKTAHTQELNFAYFNKIRYCSASEVHHLP